MKYYLIAILNLIFNLSLLSQTKPHTITLGSTFTNDFDDFGWYGLSALPFKINTLSYTYTFKDSQNHLQFIFSTSYSSSLSTTCWDRPRLEFQTYYRKSSDVFHLKFHRTVFSNKLFELKGNIGVLRRNAEASYYVSETCECDFSVSVPYTTGGASIGGSLILHLPLNLFIELTTDISYYFYFIDHRTQTFDKYSATTSAFLGLNLGYQFGGKEK